MNIFEHIVNTSHYIIKTKVIGVSASFSEEDGVIFDEINFEVMQIFKGTINTPFSLTLPKRTYLETDEFIGLKTGNIYLLFLIKENEQLLPIDNYFFKLEYSPYLEEDILKTLHL